MQSQKLKPLLEALCASQNSKNLTGEIRSPDELFSEEALEKLDERHNGIFCILVFDHCVDKDMSEYARSRAISNDTGSKILTLYEDIESMDSKQDSFHEVPGLSSISEETLLSKFVRSLFAETSLEFPGVVIVERLSQPGDAIFVLTSRGPGSNSVETMRKLWPILDQQCRIESSVGTVLQAVSVHLRGKGFQYQRSSGVSIQEHIIGLLRSLWIHRKDLNLIF